MECGLVWLSMLKTPVLGKERQVYSWAHWSVTLSQSADSKPLIDLTSTDKMVSAWEMAQKVVIWHIHTPSTHTRADARTV